MSILDEIPSFGDPEHEARVDAKMAELVATGTDSSILERAYANYEAARGNLAADKAGRPVSGYEIKAAGVRLPIETDIQPSSVAIEDMATGAKVKITTKAYAGSPLTYEQIDAALDAHGYAHRLAAQLALNNWQQTVDQLKGAA